MMTRYIYYDCQHKQKCISIPNKVLLIRYCFCTTCYCIRPNNGQNEKHTKYTKIQRPSCHRSPHPNTCSFSATYSLTTPTKRTSFRSNNMLSIGIYTYIRVTTNGCPFDRYWPSYTVIGHIYRLFVGEMGLVAFVVDDLQGYMLRRAASFISFRP